MKVIFALLLLAITGKQLSAQTPFSCSNQAYQIVSSANGLTSTLYSYDVVSGTRTSIASYNFGMNAIGYYIGDNMIWGYDTRNERVVYLDAAGAFTPVTVPDLPANGFNVGAVSTTGYYYLYVTEAARYYVIDINPSRPATYLRLVDPTNGYAIDNAPLGTTFSQASINISDWVVNPATGMLWSVVDPNSTNSYKVAMIDPTTGNVSFSTTISGNGFQQEVTAYGSVFFDVTGSFYVFANNQGRFYRVDPNTLTATVISTPGTANYNDGASCPYAAVLPVTFGSISAFIEKDILTVNFSSESETNNSHFEIEASLDGKTFKKIGQVATKAIEGNASAALSYEFSTNTSGIALATGLSLLLLSGAGVFSRRKKYVLVVLAAAGMAWSMAGCNKEDNTVTGNEGKLFVRVAQVDKDGTKSYSKVVSVVNK